LRACARAWHTPIIYAYICIVVGAIATLFGVVMLWQWNSGTGSWLDSGVVGKAGTSKNDRQFILLYFISLVLAPLLGGAIMVVFGLGHIL
jgi:hypothetical protein